MSESNMEYINSTNEETLSSDQIKSKVTKRDIISHDHLNDNKDKIDEVSPAVDDPDALILHDEGRIDLDEAIEEISERNKPESINEILKEKSEEDETMFNRSLDYSSKNCTNTGNDVENYDYFIFKGNIHPLDENKSQDNNERVKNKTDLDDNVQESFVSEYGISLLVDSDSLLSKNSLHSEHEVSEHDINDGEDQNNLDKNKYVDIQIKSEPLEYFYVNDFQKKQETIYEFQIPNKEIFSRNKVKIFEEKPVILTTSKHFIDGAYTNKANIEKIVKTEPGLPDIGESELIINDKDQYSNEAIINDTRNQIKKYEKNAPTSIKHNAKNIFFDKDGLMRIVKTEQDVPYSSEIKKNTYDKSSNKVVLTDPRIKTIKSEVNEIIDYTNKPSTSNYKTAIGINFGSPSTHDVNNITFDYFEEEKEDLFDPGWNKVRELSTDEERYRQVKECWESEDIPNPIKNLTSYSYRKRQIRSRGMSQRQRRQHKRHASNTDLNKESAKRSRSCTYIFDHRIKCIEKTKRKEAKTIQKEMFDEINRVHEQYYQQEMGVQNHYGFASNPRKKFELTREMCSLTRDYHQRVSSVTAKYGQKVYECCNQFLSEIDSLKKNRNEVLQFYSFYKGLNQNEIKDPTVLTNAQTQALEEIEHIYKKMDLYYQ